MNIQKILVFLATLLMIKVIAVILLGYGNYFPAQFSDGFLAGRQSYYFGLYRYAFLLHIISGPLSLVLGRILISEAFRIRYTRAHRTIGRAQMILVLLAVAPSGFWMAYRSDYGPWSSMGFATLASATGVTAFMGWRAVLAGRFDEHRRWMQRCFCLLCSAIVLRLMGGAASVLDLDARWSYPTAAWLSWMGPLVAYEFFVIYAREK